MKAATMKLRLRALLPHTADGAAFVGCLRCLSSTSSNMQQHAAQSSSTPPPSSDRPPLVQPFHPSHLDTPSWSTRSYLPSPSSPPPALPAGLVQRLASLAYLQLSADSLPQLERDISAMIGHISYIRHTHTTHPPIYSALQLMTAGEQGGEQVGGERVGVVSRTSADVVSDGGDAELVLRNARYTNRGFYVVPKVVDLDV